VRYNVTSLVTTGTTTATAGTGKLKGSFDGCVNATDLNKGTYNATIVINSNDPDEIMVDIPSIYRYNTSSGLFEKCDHLDDWGWWPANGV